MCARKEITEFYQPLVDLHEEFQRHAAINPLQPNLMLDLAWPGCRGYYGLLENA